MGRLLALDIGDRRIGIALSDPARVIASPLSVYDRVGYGPDTRYIHCLCEENDVDGIVCGLPLNMDGSQGFQAEKVIAFAEKLREAGLEVFFQDERLTTVSAHDALIQGGMRRDERKGVVDKVAAALILESYLQAQRQARAPRVYRINEMRTNIMADDQIRDIPENEEENGIIELTDEDGVTSRFEYLTTIEYEEQLYVVIMLIEEDEDEDDDDDEGEVLILKIEHDDESDEDVYVSVDDNEVSQKVFDKFVEMIESEEDDQE